VRRRGFQLIEVALALALAGGPLLVTMQLVRSTVRQAASAKEQATARLMLMDFATLLAGEPVEVLRDLSGTGALQEMLRSRIGRMPTLWQPAFREQVQMLAGKLSCRLEENVEGVRGLARLTLTSTLTDGHPVAVFRLLRSVPRSSLESPKNQP
jgi:hypothetical protein